MRPYKILVPLLLLMSCPKYNWGQEKFERFTVNFGLSVPFYKSPNTVRELTFVPEIELLYNIPLYNVIQLSTGIGIESGKHIVVEDVAKLVWREDVKEWWPYSRTTYWNLEFLSMKVPLYFSIPLNKFIIDSFTFGSSLGWFLNYEIIPHTSKTRINQSFWDLNLGVNKKLFKFNRISIDCSPGIGYRNYLSDRNNWQQKCFLGELKFNVNF